MSAIEYVTGDATNPIRMFDDRERIIIAHICNNVGAWGAGFTAALSTRYPEAEQAYREDFQVCPLNLGGVGYAHVGLNLWVANMTAQRGLPKRSTRKVVDYNALERCLQNVNRRVKAFEIDSVHMPRIGTGLGGGRWEEIEPIIVRTLTACRVVVYDLPK